LLADIGATYRDLPYTNRFHGLDSLFFSYGQASRNGMAQCGSSV